jgi:ATP-dependent protease ClpP protease subunit
MERKEVIERITPKRVMPFFGNVNLELYCYARDHLLKMASESTAPVTLLIDSTGGDVFSALQVVDLLHMMPVEIIGVVLEAKSSAVFVLQGCSKRLVVPSGRIMIHSIQPVENPIWKMINYDEGWEDRIARIRQMTLDFRQQAEKLICSRSHLTPKLLADYTRRGDDVSLPYQIDANEALQLGLVDEILPASYKLWLPPAQTTPAPSQDKGEPKEPTEVV